MERRDVAMEKNVAEEKDLTQIEIQTIAEIVWNDFDGPIIPKNYFRLITEAMTKLSYSIDTIEKHRRDVAVALQELSRRSS